MTPKIVRLEQFNVGWRHHAHGIRSPNLYRVTGFEFDMVDAGLAPGTTMAVEPFYAR
ncbi:MAG: hypothetical protein HC869_27175 [Rhodospirillales bacterium]|nr:hypothetical protein [Rhodospirillales bacterium]